VYGYCFSSFIMGLQEIKCKKSIPMANIGMRLFMNA